MPVIDRSSHEYHIKWVALSQKNCAHLHCARARPSCVGSVDPCALQRSAKLKSYSEKRNTSR